MGSYFQVYFVFSIFITNVNCLSPSHILLGCIPVHHLGMDQGFIQIKNDSYSTFMIGCQFDVFVGLFRHSGIGKWLKGRKWVDEMVEMGVNVLSVVHKFMHAFFHLWNIVVYLSYLRNWNWFVSITRLTPGTLNHSF